MRQINYNTPSADISLIIEAVLMTVFESYCKNMQEFNRRLQKGMALSGIRYNKSNSFFIFSKSREKIFAIQAKC
jgi:hypothetical protein